MLSNSPAIFILLVYFGTKTYQIPYNTQITLSACKHKWSETIPENQNFFSK